ncbi:Acyl-CoA N-acyltransferase [Penicillium sp. DV-2018c]|nr:Acyl-CoA N-acyltransferase [Penicillium sp. DV-2018c]
MSFFSDQVTTVLIPADVQPIRTSRLFLRPLTLGDAAALFEMRRRPDVAEWLWPKEPHKHISESEAVIARKTFTTPDASGAVRRQFFFAVMRIDDPFQRVIGFAGINSLVPAPSVGYNFHPDFWGKGYATEALAGIIDAWRNLERMQSERTALKEKLFACCNMENIGSVKVLEKVGFTKYGEQPAEGDVVALFEMDVRTT